MPLQTDRRVRGPVDGPRAEGHDEHHPGDAEERLVLLGLEVDPDKAWSEKEQVYKSSGLIIRTTNVTQTARGKKDMWTTVVAIAMFLFE